MCHTAAVEEYFGFQLNDGGEATDVEEPQSRICSHREKVARQWLSRRSSVGFKEVDFSFHTAI